ncbi:putative 24-C-methyltransferase-like [Solea senegalensis]|uniref:24-C-methyltransferase-like n=1 Tax=Solea senegalensis TaxID=28829 RepID=A0AAV6STF1_SOLSE|nr:putative 24-C-methyltransferase-like [Solea senegalensis]
MFSGMWAKTIGKQLGNPERSVLGWLVSKLLINHNQVLEESAVQLSGIHPGDTVLELGHGPGLGLQAAAKLLSSPLGHVIGVDYSEYMHQMAGERLKGLVSSGKVTLHLSDVAAMPITDNTVDKVFHCNCYYFWPNLRKATTEIHRVMKPGGLMVTTLRLSSLALASSRGILAAEKWNPHTYMSALTDAGFIDVTMDDQRSRNVHFQVIYATAAQE